MLLSNESLEVLVPADQADGAWSGELHAGLTKRITGREVVLGVDLNGKNTLPSLDTSGRADILPESTSHALRNTVSTGSSCLLVFTQHMMREGVDTKGVALSPGLLTDGGIGNDTSSFQGCVTDLDIVVRTKLNADRELARLCCTPIPDVELVNTVVGHTADVLSTGVGGAFQATVHHCWFSCHRYPSKHACDRCSLYHISAGRFPSTSMAAKPSVRAKSS